MQFIGIDPSLRHTGLCFFLDGVEPQFYEIKTGHDVLSSVAIIRELFGSFLKAHVIHPVKEEYPIFAMEKQLSVGGHSSSLMFHIQMIILEEIFKRYSMPCLVFPLPVQLTSWMRKHGIDTTSAGSIVKHFKRTENHPKRISQHCVDAYYLTRLAAEVLKGEFYYKLPSKEMALIPWKIRNGDGPG